MNTNKLSDIEEAVINFFAISRNDSTDNCIVSQDLEKNNKQNLNEDDKQFSNLELWKNKVINEDIDQQNISKNKLVSAQQNITDFTQDICDVEFNGNMWENKCVAGNVICAPSSGGLINDLKELSDLYKNNENDVSISFLNSFDNSNSSSSDVNEANVNVSNILKDLFLKNDRVENNSEIKKIEPVLRENKADEKVKNDKQIIFNGKDNLKITHICDDSQNSRETINENWSESTAFDFFDIDNDCFENCTDCKSKSSLQDDNKTSTASDLSDQESDCIEEIIIKEKINRINNPAEEDGFNDLAEGIIRESYPRVQDVAQERKQLLICADKLFEAIEYNILMRNALYDLEHALLKLIEGTFSPELGAKSKKGGNNPYRKRKFYLKYLSPYFKDKRGISFAPYVNEDILAEKDGEGSENFRKLYYCTYQPQIYDVYNAIKQYLRDNSPQGETQVKKECKKGRRKTNYENEYSDIDFDSMESQFVKFLKEYNSLHSSDPLRIFDSDIDWFSISLNPCLQGMSSKECQKVWTMVLKPLIQLGTWSGEESDKVLDLAVKYDYQNWDKIAEELGTGRTEYLCFCHVMSKPIQGITQNTGAWTQQEDEFLLKLVEKCRYGKSIMWGRIFYYIDDRTVTQILNRWYRLNPALKRGKFNHHEDSMLMYCVLQFGRDFGKIAKLFGDRSPIQLRERYFAIKDLTDKTKLGEWSVEEDRLLLSLVEEYGESKWAEIAAEFPGRNRTQIRHRYASVLKRWLAKPSFQLESLKRHKRTTHIQSVKRVKQIDTTDEKLILLVQSKLKTGKVTLKRDKRAGKQPTIGDDSNN